VSETSGFLAERPDVRPLDCLIVGGGPAGLTAAIYGARFRLSIRVMDAGGGRAALIPCTRNHAGVAATTIRNDLAASRPLFR